MKFLSTAIFNGQEFALFLEESTGRVFRAPIYDMGAPPAPAHTAPVMPLPTGGPVPAPMNYPQTPPVVPNQEVFPDKPRSIMPPGMRDLFQPDAPPPTQ